MQRGFISNVSHELKNPLASMDAQLQLSLRKELGALEYQSILQSLHDDVRELTDTAEKLLQLAKVHSEAGSVVFSPLRLDEVMLQARDSLLKMHPQYSIVFKIQSMPEQEDELLVAGNELLLKTALMNLFDNGCKFSLDHKVWVEIRFGHSGYHEVEITDKGPGIPEAELQRIFEPFFRGAGNSQVKGSGIGLSLVQSILQLHQVHMEVRSVVHSGSVFTLRFPATKPVLTDA
jgi:signal transduction histidine kinase